MFDSDFEALSASGQETFRTTVASLLTHTFILSKIWDPATGDALVNPEYNFALRNWDLIEDYLGYAGIRISRDTGYGVIFVSSFPAQERVHFDKLTTLVCYTLRLIYMDEREKLSLSSTVTLSVGDLVDKMTALGLLKGKVAKTQIRDSLRRLLRFRLIAKSQGELDDKATRIVILPSIAFAIGEDRLTSLARIARQEVDEEVEVEDEETE